MPSFTVVLTEKGPRPIPTNYIFKSHEEAINFVASKTTISRTIIYDEKGNIVDYIHPNGTRLDPNTLISK